MGRFSSDMWFRTFPYLAVTTYKLLNVQQEYPPGMHGSGYCFEGGRLEYQNLTGAQRLGFKG